MTLPNARVENLVVKQVADETLVYDLQRHRAYCLNAASSLIWGLCDGQTDARSAAASLQRELGLPADAEIVWLGVEGLRKARLLADPPEPRLLATRSTRRKFLRQAVVASAAAILLPTVISIVAPTAAQAATCVTDCTGLPDGTPCSPTNCEEICCCGTKCLNPSDDCCTGVKPCSECPA